MPDIGLCPGRRTHGVEIKDGARPFWDVPRDAGAISGGVGTLAPSICSTNVPYPPGMGCFEE